MAASITHAKVVNTAQVPDPTQGELNAQIALGNYPAGTVLADIALGSDFNSAHTFPSTGSGNYFVLDTSPTFNVNTTTQSSAVNDGPVTGAELLSASGWTSTNWTGSFATGWIHTVGFNDVLSNSLAATVGVTYKLTWTVTGRTAGTCFISFGQAAGDYNTECTASGVTARSATTVDGLYVTPTADFDGTIVISVKQVTAPSTAIYIGKSSDTTTRYEIRTPPFATNTFSGVNAGGYFLGGTNNTVNGDGAGARLAIGSDNTLTGAGVGGLMELASRNSVYGVGGFASGVNITDATGIGYRHAYSMTSSSQSLFIGSYAAYTITTSNDATVIGAYALYLGSSVKNYLTIVGTKAAYSGGANELTCIGAYSGYSTSGGSETSYTGYRCGYTASSVAEVTGNGAYCLYFNTASYNTFTGAYAAYNKPGGTWNTGMGTEVMYNGNATYSYCAFFGGKAGYACKGDGNSGYGYQSGRHVTTGTYNTFGGYNSGFGNGTNNTISYCTLIGTSTASTVDGVTNSSVLGNGGQITRSNQVVLGNTSVAETLLRGCIGAAITAPSATLHLNYATDTTLTGDTDGTTVVINMSSTSALRVGQLVTGTDFSAGTTIASIDSATQITLSAAATGTTVGLAITAWTVPAKATEGTLIPTTEAGAIEFASDRIYYTIPTGTARKTIAYTTDIGSADMVLASVQSVTGLKTFDKDKLAMKGTSTGVTTFSTANTGASNYTATVPAKTGTFAYTANETHTVMTLAAGTASAGTAPIYSTSGTLLTSAEASAHEYDGTSWYKTIDTTSGRMAECNQHVFRLTSNGSAIGAAIADFFGANSAFPTVTNGVYEMTFYLYFLKSTAGTVTYTLTNTQTYTNCVVFWEGSAVGGVGSTAATGGSGTVTGTSATLQIGAASSSLTNATNHRVIINALVECGTAGNIRLQVTESAGTVTPLRGSYYTVRRLPSANVGTFAA